jgi:hypothetical protein
VRRALLITILLACAACTGPPAGYSAAALFNAGNAYARAGKTGMAVLNFERAQLLAPDDADIQENLRIVRDSAGLPAETPGRIARLVTVAGPQTLAWSGLAGVVIAGGAALALRIRRRPPWLLRGLMLAGIALVALTVCNGAVTWPRLQTGVVIVAAAPVRVAPVPLGEPLFVLKEAETVRLTAAHEGFVLVRTASGRTGWASQADVAAVVPRNGS